ncbi:MAG: M6 family metalloprotease domain-containing protein [Candidatus Hodarchaeota archaeon]
MPSMKLKSYNKRPLVLTLMFALTASMLFFTPFTLSLLTATSEFEASALVSMPSVSRFGLDGPIPPEVSYSPMATTGQYDLIIILVEFTDKTHTFNSTEVRNNAVIALDDYIDEVSYGLTQVGGNTTVWLNLGHDRAYYVDGTSFPSEPKFELVQDSINLADPIVDFSAYDGVTIIHAGQGQELSHDWRDYWSSEWWGFSIVKDGVTITRASVSPEESTVGNPSYVGVLAHEFGHDLGLPDLYDVVDDVEYVGHWGLMAKGSWNGPSMLGEQPAHMMGYCKSKLGWVNSTHILDVTTEATVIVDPLELSTTGVQLVRINVTTQQYFLIEVRLKIGYDASLPGVGAGSQGVVLTYVDETISSGHGIVKVVDSHPSTATKDDGAFGIGPGEVSTYVSSIGQFSMRIENIIGQSYNISILRDTTIPVINSVQHIPINPAFGDLVTVFVDVTDDTWIVNGTVYYQVEGDSQWYRVAMTYFAGDQWRGILGTFLPGVRVTYYVAVTDSGGHTVVENNSGAYYTFQSTGISKIIYLIVGAVVVLIVVGCLCMLIQRRRNKSRQVTIATTSSVQAFGPSSRIDDTDTGSLPPTYRTGFCYHCGAPLTPNAIFCGHCGRSTE